MYALHVLGQDAEKLFGSGRFLGVYLSALIGGNLVFTLLSPLNRPTIGASGAILGL
jgi:membrane associated rhomboid family serine protease